MSSADVARMRREDARRRRAGADGALSRLLDAQERVVSRAQALELGLTPSDVARSLRRREWSRVHAGVYVAQTGPLTWRQRAWAAVLHAAPAVLDGPSALRAHEGDLRGRRWAPDGAPIEVAVAHDRIVVAPAGVVVTRRRGLADRALWSANPPRLRYDDAIAAVADSAGDDLTALAVLSDAVGSRRTTAPRLERAVGRRPAGARRRWLLEVLGDVRAGTCSVLEHVFLTDVVRAHGLPEGVLQASGTTRTGRCRRDVDHPQLGIVIELDGVLHHTALRDRDADLDRDLVAATGGRRTVRIGWGQARGRACWTAAQLYAVFRLAGWDGVAVECGAGCVVGIAA